MAKSLRSKSERKKRFMKRKKLFPREMARLNRLSEAGEEALQQQLASKVKLGE